ncbi:MAG: hypothetical protein ACYC8T_15375 [Myxococcaceae bacterium]
MIATLHHLPLTEALTRAATLLRPGGVLAVLGLHRSRPVDYALSAVAFPVSWYHRRTRRSSAVRAPLADPTMTLDQIRRGVVDLLPGATVRRHLLWRHSMRWVKPASG